jgi:antirestriction protein
LDNNAAMGWHALDEGLVQVPEHLWSYIDVEALGRDWLMDFSVSTNGYVFEV